MSELDKLQEETMQSTDEYELIVLIATNGRSPVKTVILFISVNHLETCRD